tara:strand:- start:194 stop:364 length:171 start_codon:yes stop_codon:yes gene_type:complete
MNYFCDVQGVKLGLRGAVKRCLRDLERAGTFMSRKLCAQNFSDGFIVQKRRNIDLN